MEILFDSFGLYNVDVPYLKYLHDNIDSEVYYNDYGYEKKPFLGTLIGIDNYLYFIPLTSSKEKHLTWPNVTSSHYVIYEYIDIDELPKDAVYKPYEDNLVKHLIAVLDIKKMIPVPKELIHKIDISTEQDSFYKTILLKEYNFCKRIKSGIIERVIKIYTQQKTTGRVHKFFCNFSKLENACDNYFSTLN